MTINERITLAKNAFKTTYADKDPAIMGITAAYQRATSILLVETTRTSVKNGQSSCIKSRRSTIRLRA